MPSRGPRRGSGGPWSPTPRYSPGTRSRPGHPGRRQTPWQRPPRPCSSRSPFEAHGDPRRFLDTLGSRIEDPAVDVTDVAVRPESVTLEEIRTRAVLLCRDELAHQTHDAAAAGLVVDVLQDRRLDGKAQHTAAQQDVVDEPGVTLLAHHRGADEAVLTEPVHDVQHVDLVLTGTEEPFDVGRLVSTGGGVELVRLVEHLHEP